MTMVTTIPADARTPLSATPGAWLAVALMLFALGIAGCGATSGDSSDRMYRTISVEPGRDTDAAIRANEQGLKHVEAGDLDAAKRAFERALAADVKFGPAHNNLGKVFFQQDELYKAAWEFEYARKLLPKHPEPHNNLGLVHEQAGELGRAIEHYREAVDLAPENLVYVGNLARALIKSGDHSAETRRLLERIIAQDSRVDWVAWAREQLARAGG